MKYILLVFILLTAVGSAYAWDNNDRDYRKEVTVSHINGSGSDLINYPAFLNISKTDCMQADYDDLIFYDASGNLMAAELEKGYTDYALVWINISTLSISGTSFWMYYGNTICSDSWDVEGVWNSGYAMVQHLNESPTNGVAGHIDSTNNDNDGTPEGFGGIPGSTTDAEGIIDGANVFDGANDYIDCGIGESLNIANEITVSAWLKPVGYYYYAGYNTANGLYITSTKAYFRVDGVNAEASFSFSTNNLYHVVWTRTGTTYNCYVNGNFVNTFEGQPDNVLIRYIGSRGSPSTYPFNGSIDEVRVSNSVRTPDRIKQNYELVINQTTMTTFGDVETANGFLQEASYFHIEMVDGLTDFRDSMGKYLVWGIVFFAVGLSFALFAKIKQTLIGGK